MSHERSIESQEAQIARLPPEFKALAEWGWGELRAGILRRVMQLGVNPIAAGVIASRLARLVVSQVYSDVREHRRLLKRAGNAIVFALLALAPAAAAAQTPVGPTTEYGWDQEAPSLADARAYRYTWFVDGVRNIVALPITCAEKSPPVANVFDCRTAAPTMAAGHRVLALTAAVQASGQWIESPRSNTLTVLLITAAPPAVPRNLRAIPPPAVPPGAVDQPRVPPRG